MPVLPLYVRLSIFYITIPLFIVTIMVMVGVKLAQALPATILGVMDPKIKIEYPPLVIEEIINSWCSYATT